MSGPQPPPTRPWFRLASMVRPADPRPPPPPPPPPSPPPTTIAALPSPKKPTPAPASPPSATATPKVGMDSAILNTSTRNSPLVEARSPATTVMSPGVPRLPTTSLAPTSPLLASPNEEYRVITSTGKSSTATPPPPSPYKPKSMTPPPSPLLLPPPQMSATHKEPRMIPPEAEQKTVLVQEETIPATTLATYPAADTQNNSFQQLNKNNSIDAAARRTNGGTVAHHPPATYKENEADKIITTTNKPTPKLLNKKKLESDLEAGMKVITIAGENRGAIMELVRSSPPPSGKSVGHYTGRPSNKVMSDNERESYSSASDNGEESGVRKYKKSNKDKSNSSSRSIPMTAFMNSNVQGVNNSIFFNAHCTHHDPGVHVSLSRKPSSVANANLKSKTHNGNG